MRNDEVLYNKIMSFADANDNVRVVEMNGSRVNPHVNPDQYQDFDIVFYVADHELFLRDQSWMEDLGDIILSQTTSDQRDSVDRDKGSFIYMLQFKNGTRLDLSVVNIQKIKSGFHRDSLSMILLDKDGYGLHDTRNESDYYVKMIHIQDFHYCVNEFFWLVPYVAKGIARKQWFYALKHLDMIRSELEILIDAWIGHNHHYHISVGKVKSRYELLMPKALYHMYELTYATVDASKIWNALFSALDLFDQIAGELASMYAFPYVYSKKDEMIAFIREHFQ